MRKFQEIVIRSIGIRLLRLDGPPTSCRYCWVYNDAEHILGFRLSACGNSSWTGFKGLDNCLRFPDFNANMLKNLVVIINDVGLFVVRFFHPAIVLPVVSIFSHTMFHQTPYQHRDQQHQTKYYNPAVVF